MTGLVATMNSEGEGDRAGATTATPGAYTSTHGPLLALNDTPPSWPACCAQRVTLRDVP